ncbi:hypothetical protein [Halalkalicoccus tibetensis]|uniref:Small CPxCG-related zinc finger protein n=1 Tax=Halalkalicoccus tibetensis TaxID=175632 RepID=A0ABD5V997_9EURY
MGRYPREARSARIKCIACNAPVVRTVEGEYVCVDCGDTPVEPTESSDPDGEGVEPRPATD